MTLTGSTLRLPQGETWRRQVLVSSRPALRAGSVECASIGGFLLHAYPDAKLTPVVDAAGQQIGAFVGTLIDAAARRVVQGPLLLDLPLATSASDAVIESFAYRYSGSWLLLLQTPTGPRIYLDCDGSLSLVYDPALRAAASTTGLLLDDDSYRARFDAELYAALGVAGEGWFPSGLTAHHGVRRLLCNHYLDLSTWRPVRHWPVSEPRWTARPRDAGIEIAGLVRGATEALLSEGSVVSALTGGNETRFMLAANREIRERLSFATVVSPSTLRDVDLARRLVGIGGLRHEWLPLVVASQDEQDAWAFRSSHGITGPNMASHPSIRPLGRFSSFIGGLGGEIGRAFFWRPTDAEQTRFTAETLVPRFGMPMHPAVIAATHEWLQGVKGLNGLTQLDLAYLELRMSAWAFVQEYADNTVPHIHPMISRASYELMLALPPEAKRSNALIREAVAALWPEIAAVPINRYGDYRDTLQTLRRLANPRLVVKKLRKMFG